MELDILGIIIKMEKHMMLVPTEVHGSVGHSGGVNVAKASKNGKKYKEVLPGPDKVNSYLTKCQ